MRLDEAFNFLRETVAFPGTPLQGFEMIGNDNSQGDAPG